MPFIAAPISAVFASTLGWFTSARASSSRLRLPRVRTWPRHAAGVPRAVRRTRHRALFEEKLTIARWPSLAHMISGVQCSSVRWFGSAPPASSFAFVQLAGLARGEQRRPRALRRPALWEPSVAQRGPRRNYSGLQQTSERREQRRERGEEDDLRRDLGVLVARAVRPRDAHDRRRRAAISIDCGTTTPPTMADSSKRQRVDPIDRYDIGELLGEGAFATVRRATRKSDGTAFAIKLIEKESTSADDAEHERKILSALGLHRHIVSLVDSFDVSDATASSSLAEGGELREAVRRRRVLGGRRGVGGAAGGARARVHAHGRRLPPRPQAREPAAHRRRRRQGRRLRPRRLLRRGRAADDRRVRHRDLHGARDDPVRARRRGAAVHVAGRPLLRRRPPLRPPRRVQCPRPAGSAERRRDPHSHRRQRVVV